MGRNIRKEAAWELSAPLGELPAEETIKLVAELISEKDRFHRTHAIRYHALNFVKELLKEVRGREGVHSSRSAYPKGLVFPLSWSLISVLTAVGVHGTRSVYALHYARVRADESGRPPYSPWWVRTRVAHLPQVRAQLEVLEERLFDRYPALRSVSLKGLSAPPVFLQVVERGEVAFAVSAEGRATHVLVGKKAVFPLRKPYDGERLFEAADEALVKVLRRETALGSLPPKAVLELLRRDGDRRAVERALAMARLGTL
jgi:hypothetical protein